MPVGARAPLRAGLSWGMILRIPALLAAAGLAALVAAPALGQNGAPARRERAAKPAPEPAAESGGAEAPARGRRGAERAKPGAKAAAKPGAAPAGLQATQVAVFGDWNVFAAGQGRARICYAITQPKTRLPAALKRDAAYLFVTVRKAENLPNEVALIMGFAARTQAASGGPRGAADPAMTVGTTTYGLVVKEANAWLANPSDEVKAVAEMGRVQKLVVKATSLRGNPSTDEYSLAGFGDAMKRTREECK